MLFWEEGKRQHVLIYIYIYIKKTLPFLGSKSQNSSMALHNSTCGKVKHRGSAKSFYLVTFYWWFSFKKEKYHVYKWSTSLWLKINPSDCDISDLRKKQQKVLLGYIKHSRSKEVQTDVEEATYHLHLSESILLSSLGQVQHQCGQSQRSGTQSIFPAVPKGTGYCPRKFPKFHGVWHLLHQSQCTWWSMQW